MKEGWEYKKLGEITIFSQGIQVDVNLQTEIYSPGKVRFLRIIDVTHGNVPPRYIDDPGERYYLKADEIAMVRYGTVGFVCYGFEGVIANNLFKVSIKDKSKLQSNYLQYYLKSDLFQSHIRKGVGGVALPAIKFGDIKNVILGFPPLSEQQSIVDYLDSAFAKIDAMKANAEKALGEAKALFQASLKEMLEPKEGWEEKILKEICRVINGRAYSKDEMLKQGKYRLLRVGNFFTNDSWFYSDLELEEDKYCDNGDLLYAWSASFGPRIWDGEKVIYHYHIWKMVCSEKIDKYFMCYWLDSDELKKQTMTNLHGATMAHITKGIIEAALVRFPSLSEQQSIVDTLDSLKSKVDRLQKNYEKISQECDALKQAILRQVFT